MHFYWKVELKMIILITYSFWWKEGLKRGKIDKCTSNIVLDRIEYWKKKLSLVLIYTFSFDLTKGYFQYQLKIIGQYDAKHIIMMLPINIYYHWFVLQEWISQRNITSKVNHEMWDTMRSPFQAKHIYYSMFISERRIRRWQYYVSIMLVAW